MSPLRGLNTGFILRAPLCQPAWAGTDSLRPSSVPVPLVSKGAEMKMPSVPCLLLMPWVLITSIKKIVCAQELGSLRENISRCPGHLRQGLPCCRSAPFLLEPPVPRSDHTNSNSQCDPWLSQRQEPWQSWGGREAGKSRRQWLRSEVSWRQKQILGRD